MFVFAVALIIYLHAQHQSFLLNVIPCISTLSGKEMLLQAVDTTLLQIATEYSPCQLLLQDRSAFLECG